MTTYQFRPLNWNGPTTPAGHRTHATFRAAYSATLELLFREAEKLGARHLVLQVDLAERDIRVDGLPRANARYGSNPGVSVSFDSKHGPLQYASDAYTDWQDNLRAIALSLQALRAVDRYGVSKRGEQYTGWKALPSAPPAAFGSADEAWRWMCHRAFGNGTIHDLTEAKDVYRRLARVMHPDAGGDPADWARLDAARQFLTAAAGL